MLHGVPLDPLLRPDVSETVRPRTPELRHAVVVEVVLPRAELRGEGRGSGTRPCTSPRTHLPALAILCPRGAVWCVNSARATATTAARASRQRAVVALFAAVRLPWRVRHSSCRPLKVVSTGDTNKGMGTLDRKRPCVIVVVVVVLDAIFRAECLRQQTLRINCAGALDGKELFAIEGSAINTAMLLVGIMFRFPVRNCAWITDLQAEKMKFLQKHVE